MADPRTAIFASVAKRQAGLDPQPGDVYLRDGEALIVSSRTESRVQWRSASGDDHADTLQGFRERAVESIDIAGGGNYLDHVWQLASSTGIPRDVRALAVQRAARRAQPAEALTVGRWARTLASGREPTRTA
jgi:hypothetical protein